MDRSWMNHRGINDRRNVSYVHGITCFLEFSFKDKEVGTKLRCPCLKCNFQLFHDRRTMKNHLIGWGIVRDYNPWVHHGESVPNNGINDEGIELESYTSEDDLNADNFVMGDDLVDLLFDATTSLDDSRFPSNVESFREFEDRDNEMPKEFEYLMQDLEADLYPGCKTYKRLEFIVTLLHNKVSGN
ncbi:unnamed protein product [Amaranthus hypochondriacus]